MNVAGPERTNTYSGWREHATAQDGDCLRRCAATSLFGHTTDALGLPVQIHAVALVAVAACFLTVHRGRVGLIYRFSLWFLRRGRWDGGGRRAHFLECRHSATQPHDRLEEARVLLASAKPRRPPGLRHYVALYGGVVALAHNWYDALPCWVGVAACHAVVAMAASSLLVLCAAAAVAACLPAFAGQGLVAAAWPAGGRARAAAAVGWSTARAVAACACGSAAQYRAALLLPLAAGGLLRVLWSLAAALGGPVAVLREVLAPAVVLATAGGVDTAWAQFALAVCTRVGASSTSPPPAALVHACHPACPAGRLIVLCFVQSTAAYYTGCWAA